MAAFLLLALLPCPAYAHYEGELLPDSVAVMEYRMVISMNPSDTLTRNKLGMVYIRQGKLEKARLEFMEILKLAPNDFDALDSLGIVSEKEGKLAEAASWFARAMEVMKDDAGVRGRHRAVLERIEKGGK
jgi:Flp pilus assembly protein TadD